MVTNEASAEAPAEAVADAQQHPAVAALRRLLTATHGEVGESLHESLSGGAAQAAYNIVSCGVAADHNSALAHREELSEELNAATDKAGDLIPALQEVWITVVGPAEGETAPNNLGPEETEELVLAYLCACPLFLSRILIRRLVQQVSCGQGLLHADDRHLDTQRLLQSLEPCMLTHQPLADRIALESCSHLLQRSAELATKLLQRLDLDGDGIVSESDFLRGAHHALALEVENIAVAAGVQALLADPGFTDDFHPAMADALSILPASE